MCQSFSHSSDLLSLHLVRYSLAMLPCRDLLHGDAKRGREFGLRQPCLLADIEEGFRRERLRFLIFVFGTT